MRYYFLSLVVLGSVLLGGCPPPVGPTPVDPPPVGPTPVDPPPVGPTPVDPPPVDPTSPSASIGNLEVVGRPFCLTGFNACEDLGGYESLARAFYLYVNANKDNPDITPATIGAIISGGSTALEGYFPTIMIPGGTAINPRDTDKLFVMVKVSSGSFPDVLLVDTLSATQWKSVNELESEGFVLARSLVDLTENSNDNIYHVDIEYSREDTVTACTSTSSFSDACITVRSGIGSKNSSTNAVQDLYVLGSGFAMLKVLFPDDLNARDMFGIVTNTKCRDSGYFSFDCVVNGDNIEISYLTPGTSSSLIGTLAVMAGRPSCLTKFNACVTLGGYESLARAFYHYVNENKDSPPASPVTYGRAVVIDNNPPSHAFSIPEITTPEGTINPFAFVTVENIVISGDAGNALASLPDVLVVNSSLNEGAWANVNAGGEGFILIKNFTNLTTDNNSTDLYVVNVNAFSATVSSDCAIPNTVDACVSVRKRIGDSLNDDGSVSTGISSDTLDLYVLGSGFAMLKVLFPDDLNARDMFGIVTNTKCRDSGYFSFDCVVDEDSDNIEISYLDPKTDDSLIGTLEKEGSPCLTGFNACEDLGGYESLARAFYLYVDDFTGTQEPIKIGTTLTDGSTVLGEYFPTITTPGGDIDPSAFVMVEDFDVSTSVSSLLDVLVVPVALDATQWGNVSVGGDGFVLANDVETLTENSNDNIYHVDIEYSREDTVTACTSTSSFSDACITVRSGIGSKNSSTNAVQDLYVLGSGFAMLKVLFPDDLNARDMFNIVTNTKCRDGGYFSFDCVVDEDSDNIEISYLDPKTDDSLIGTLEKEGSPCLTGFNACEDLGGYESLARAFYLYVDDFTGTQEPIKIGTTLTDGSTVLGEYFPTITTPGGDIDPSAFVMVEDFDVSTSVSSLLDVLVVPVALDATQWGNVSVGGDGFVLANDVETLTENSNDNIYHVDIEYSREDTVTACTSTSSFSDACITVRSGIGSKNSSTNAVQDLYVLGSGFAMLKVLFPDDLNARDMFGIVTNTKCRDSGYFSFDCVVDEDSDNIEISYLDPKTDDSLIGTLEKEGSPCLTGFNACEDLGGYESLARAFYLYVDDFTGTQEPIKIGTTLTDGSTVLGEYFPTITTPGGDIDPSAFVMVEDFDVSTSVSSLLDVLIVPVALDATQWGNVSVGGDGFVLANDVETLTENSNDNIYHVDIEYSREDTVTACTSTSSFSDACITVRSGIGSKNSSTNAVLDLYVLGSGFAMLKVLFPDDLNARDMFNIVTNTKCRDSGYFSFDCVVDEDSDNIEISYLDPKTDDSLIGTLEKEGSPCLTKFNACVTLSGYESLARAFYHYVNANKDNPDITHATIGTTVGDGSTVLGEYFPTITTSGGDIDPSAFVMVEAIAVSRDADNALASLPDVLVAGFPDATQWGNVNSGGEGFVLADYVGLLTEETNDDIYIVDVDYGTGGTAPACTSTSSFADACITVRNNIGDLLNDDGTVSTGISSDTLDLYVLGSGFAMLKVLFPDDLNARDMFDIATNENCRDRGYFSFDCVVDEDSDNIEISYLDPKTDDSLIGTLAREGSSCLTDFNACEDLDGYQSLARAFYLYVDANKDNTDIMHATIGTTVTDGSTVLRGYFPTITTPGGTAINPSAFVTVENTVVSLNANNALASLPDVLLVDTLTNPQWFKVDDSVGDSGEGFVLANDVTLLAPNNANLYIVNVNHSAEDVAPDCTDGNADACITVRSGIGSKNSSTNAVQDLYVLGSGFAMLKVLFPDDLNARDMFGIVTNAECRDTAGYFFFDCVVDEDGGNIEVSHFIPAISPIGTLEGERPSCLTRFNACADLVGYESLARAFYHYVDDFTGTPVSATIGTTIANGSTVLIGYFPTITTPGGTAINPSAFVTVADFNTSTVQTSLPDVLITGDLSATKWSNVNETDGEGFVLALGVGNLVANANANIYIVNVNHSADDAPDCSVGNASACITVRENIGDRLSYSPSTGTASKVNALYVLGSGFAMLKALFPDDLNSRDMFGIVTNDNCRDSGYFSFECVVGEDSENIEVSYLIPRTSSIGTLEVGSLCLTDFNACTDLGGYQSIVRAFYHYIATFDGTPVPTTIGTTIANGSTVLRKYFPTITPNGGTEIKPLNTSKPFVTVANFNTNIVQTSLPDVLVVPSLSTTQWGNVSAGGEGFVLANSLVNLTENANDNIYHVDVQYGTEGTALACTQVYAACITVRNNIGDRLNSSPSTGIASNIIALYVLGSGFAMLKALLPNDLSPKDMFDIVTNNNCRDRGYFSFECVVDEDSENIKVSHLIPATSSIGTLEVGRPSCLTRFNACVTLGGYESLARAFYHHVDTFDGSPVPTTIGTTISESSTDLERYFPTITTSGGDIDPSAFVKVEVPNFLSSYPPLDVLIEQDISLFHWDILFHEYKELFVLTTDLKFDIHNRSSNDNIYVVDVEYRTGATVSVCTPVWAFCITVRKNIGAFLSSDGTVSERSRRKTLDLYVLGSGFAMLKTLFPNDLNARDMFDIVKNTECRDSGNYFSFDCVVDEDGGKIDIFFIASLSPIGTLKVGRPSCLTGFNACETLVGYESLARAFYQYVDANKDNTDITPATIGTTVVGDGTVLRKYFPMITSDGGDIDPSAFVTVEGFDFSTVSPLPDVLVVPSPLDLYQWLNVSGIEDGEGFVLANNVGLLTEETGDNIYIVDVNYSAGDDASDCADSSADACITVRENIGALLNSDGTVSTETSNDTLDLYVLGSGFAMLKVLFPDDLDAEWMFDIVTNDNCRDSGYFSFDCVVKGDNIEVSHLIPATSSIGNFKEVVGRPSCLTGFNACEDLGGYGEIVQAFYLYVDTFDGTPVSTTIGTNGANGSTVLRRYFPMITPNGGTEIRPLGTNKPFVMVEDFDFSTVSPLPDVFVVPEALDATQWSNVSGAEGEGFVLANDVETLTEETNDNIYIVDVNYSAGDDALSCSAGIADACITVRENIGALLNSDGTVSTGTSSTVRDLYVLGSGFAMLKVLFPDNLDAEGMFDIVTNDNCRDGGYFSFDCVVKGDNIEVSYSTPETSLASIGTLEIEGERPSCLTGFKACINLGGYESLARAFYHYVDTFDGTPVSTTINIDYAAAFYNFKRYFPTITTSGGDINPLDTDKLFVTIVGFNPNNALASLPDVLVILDNRSATQWANVIAGGGGFVLANDVDNLGAHENENIYIVNVNRSVADDAPDCSVGNAGACITMRENIGALLNDDGTVSTRPPRSYNDLFVLGSGFAMLKVLFPDGLNARDMFDIVENPQCRDSGNYFSFECVVNGDNIDIFFASSFSPIGTLEVVGRPSCLTGFNACEGLGGYEEIVQAFYLYVDTFDTSETPEPATIGTTLNDDSTVLGGYFPTITTSGGVIDPSAFVTVEDFDVSKISPLPDVLVVPSALNATQWGNVIAGGGGIVLANDVGDLTENTNENIYIVNVDSNSVATVPDCSAGTNACITVRKNIGALLNYDGTVSTETANDTLDLYVLGSGFVMLKVLFPNDLNPRNMFDIVTNPECRDSGYFSFDCVVNGDNIEVSSFIPSILSPIGTLEVAGIPSCLTGFNACVDLGGYEDIVQAFYLYVDGFTGTQVSTTIGTTLTNGSTVLGGYFPTITPNGGTAINPLDTDRTFVTVGEHVISVDGTGTFSGSFPNVLIVPVALSTNQWLITNSVGGGFVLANDVTNLIESNNSDELYVVNVDYSAANNALNCSAGNADACITVRKNIGILLNDDGTVSTGTANDTRDLYVLGSGFAMLKVLFPTAFDAERMFDIATNENCRDRGYFSFECVVKGDNIEIFFASSFSPIGTLEVGDRSCLTRLNACVTLGGYASLARAFYLYVNDFIGPPIRATIGDIVGVTFKRYFPTITTDPSAFVSAIYVDLSSISRLYSLPDVFVVHSANEVQWSLLTGGPDNKGFILASNLQNLTKADVGNYTGRHFLVNVNSSTEGTAPACANGLADACITVKENIGVLLNDDGTVSTGTANNFNDLYVLGSGFVMLKVLFPTLLYAEGMLGIVKNTECRDMAGYFSFGCVVEGDNIKVLSLLTPGTSLSPIGTLDVGGSPCLTGFNACVDLGGYEPLARAFYLYVDDFTGTPVSATIGTTVVGDGTVLGGYFPTITISGDAIVPSTFVTVASFDVSTISSLPDVLIAGNLGATQWGNVNAGGEGFVLANDVGLLTEETNDNIYIVDVNYSAGDDVLACTSEPADACITVKENIGALLNDNGTVSTGTSNDTLDLYVLGSGFAMLKVLFPDDLDAEGMFDIVTNENCRDSGYFSFDCVVKGDNIEVSYFTPGTDDSPIGILETVSLCLTSFNACETLVGYESLARAFYQYVDANKDNTDITPATIGTTVVGDGTVLRKYFPMITSDGGVIAPSAFVMVEDFDFSTVSPLPDVLVVPSPLDLYQWGNVNAIDGEGFVLANDVRLLSENTEDNIYIVDVNYSAGDDASDCADSSADACITVRENIGDLLGTSPPSAGTIRFILDLYVVGSGFAMLKVLFPDDLNARDMFGIVTNVECRDVAGYFSFGCVVDEDNDNIEISYLTPETSLASIGTLEVVGSSCLTGFNACETLVGYESLARAFYQYVDANKDNTDITPATIGTTVVGDGTVLRKYFPMITSDGGVIAPSAFVMVEDFDFSTVSPLPDVLVVPSPLDLYQWGNVNAIDGEGFVLANDVRLLSENTEDNIYIVDVDYSAGDDASDCADSSADACITVRENIGALLNDDGTVSTETSNDTLDLYVLGSGFAMLKVLFPDNLDAEGMFDIVTNGNCRDSGYFSFNCVVNGDNIEVSYFTPETSLASIGTLEVVGSSCLTGFNACETLVGYESLARAFYQYVDANKDNTDITPATIGTTVVGDGTVLRKYFPMITSDGGVIAPSAFVMVEDFDFSTVSPLPDVLVVPSPLDLYQWGNVNAIDGEGFVLANDVRLLSENTEDNIYIVDVDYSAGDDASDCADSSADACITVRENIGALLNDDGTVSTETSNDTLDLYVLGSGFAMLKVLFPDNLDAEGMFDIVTNGNCRDSGYFSFNCVVNGDNIEVSYFTPETSLASIGTLEVVGSSCLTGFNACETLVGYESLARAFYQYVDANKDNTDITPATIGTTVVGDGTVLRKYFPMITSDGGVIAPSAFVMVEDFDFSTVSPLPDVLVVPSPLDLYQWGNVNAIDGEGFVLANDVRLLSENTEDNIYIVDVDYSAGDDASDCADSSADACITVRENIGALLNDDGTVSTETSNDTLDLYVLGSGFAMLKVLFPDNLDAEGMFDIVTNGNCRDSGYFSFNCVVNGDNIEVSYFTPETSLASIGTLEVVGSSCLTGFNACETLVGYESLARAFYQYVDANKDNTDITPATIGTTVVGDGTVLRKYFPMITSDGGVIAPSAFVMVEDFDFSTVSPLPDVLVVPSPLDLYQWGNVNAIDGEGFVLANDVRLLSENTEDNIYIVDVNYSAGDDASDCADSSADACITVRENIGDLLGTSPPSAGTIRFILDLYVVGSGFAMLKVLFPDDLNARDMFGIVTNVECRDVAGYFSFGCVVDEDNDNIEISYLTPETSLASIGTLEVVGSSCLTGFNACETLVGYESLARAFYQYVDGFTGTQVSTTIGTTLTNGSTVLGGYFPMITSDGGVIVPSAFVMVEAITVSGDADNALASLPDVFVVPEALDATQWSNVSGAEGEGFVLANDVETLTEETNDNIYIVDVDYSAGDDALACTSEPADACIAVRSGIGSNDSTVSSMLDLYVLGSGFVMLKVLFPDDLNARDMFDIVTNGNCRDSGYFSFDCVVNVDNIEVSYFTPETSLASIGTLEVVGSSCLTGFNACADLGGYASLARAFYQYVDGFTGTQVSTTIGTTLTNGSTVLGGYFPTITTSGGDIAPSAFVTVEAITVSGDADNALASLHDVFVVPEALDATQWSNVSGAEGEGFVLANDVETLTEETNDNIYIVDVNYSAGDDALACTSEPADACIAVRSGIGSNDSTVSSMLDLYVLGSGFVMLKVLFPDDLNARDMFDIVTNGNCRDSGYFSFDCVVNVDNIEVSYFTPETSLASIGTLEVVGSSCLTGFNACADLGGYASLARAFYQYVDGFTGTQVSTTIGTTLTNGSTVLGGYFPTITTSGGDIAPSAFVTVEAITVSGDADNALASLHDVFVVPEALDATQWSNVSGAEGEGFVLANDVETLTEETNDNIYIVDVNYSAGDDALACTSEPADACITVRKNIGALLSSDGTVSTGTSNDTLDLYVLGSGFAMLKVLFPDDLDAEGMFNIVINDECRDTNGYFSFECLVIDNTRIVPTVPEEESTSGEASSSQNKPLTSAFARLIARSLAARHAPSKDGTYFTQEKTVLEEGSILITQQGTSATSGTSVRAIRMRAVYRGEGASVGTLVGAYHYNHTLSALSRDAVDMRVELGMVGDVDVLSGMKLYGHILGVYETGVLTVAFGEHRVDRMMGVGVVGLSYRVSSGANVLADAAIEGRCSVGNAVWVAGSVAYASSFCDTILKLRISF